MARRNLGGVKRILATMPDERERNCDPCIQFLLGWSCEGYLKTFLAANKMSDKELRLEIGHDLIEAFEVATAKGLDYPEIGRLHIVIGHLAPGHLDMHWRYMPTNADGSERQFNLVWPSLAIPALDALDQAVWSWVQTDFGKTLAEQGLSPHPGWRPVLD